MIFKVFKYKIYNFFSFNHIAFGFSIKNTIRNIVEVNTCICVIFMSRWECYQCIIIEVCV